MEADWEIEIGNDAPIIDAYWSGFVDLRLAPKRITEIEETIALAGLAETLTGLNSSDSHVWTSKCDVFEPDRVDAGELDASKEETAFAKSCYIDLLMREELAWDSLPAAERACRELCARLRKVSLRCSRVDLVVRRAMLHDRETFGVTAYVTGCGSSSADADTRLARCLTAFADTVKSRSNS